MNELNHFSETILNLRKKAGMTQEGLANALGISAQAVSKWENGAGLPDVTLFPKIAEIFEVSLDELFGRKAKNAHAAELPRELEGLSLIRKNERIACYSDKELKGGDDANITFIDGSVANLTDGTVINKGKGEIKLLYIEQYEKQYEKQYSMEKKEKTYSFGMAHNIEAKLKYPCNVTVKEGEAGKTEIRAFGTERFLSRLSCAVENDTLKLTTEGIEGNAPKEEDELLIFMGEKSGESLHVSIIGASDCFVVPYFKEDKIDIVGCGDVTVGKTETLVCSIKGSGDVTADTAKSARIVIAGSGDAKLSSADELILSIHGSGDFDAEEIRKNASVSVNGSGDVCIGKADGIFRCDVSGSGDIMVKSGEMEELTVQMSGTGDFHGKEVCTKKADLRTDNGDITVGRVVVESIERAGKIGKITVYKRG